MAEASVKIYEKKAAEERQSARDEAKRKELAAKIQTAATASAEAPEMTVAQTTAVQTQHREVLPPSTSRPPSRTNVVDPLAETATTQAAQAIIENTMRYD